MTIIMSLVGIVTLFLIAWLLSDNKKHINYRTVVTAFGLQVSPSWSVLTTLAVTFALFFMVALAE